MLSACAGAAIPVAMITKNGHTFHGTVRGTFPTDFQISDGGLTCSGRLPLTNTHTFTVVITCSDGRRGIAIVTRETVISGGGTLRLSDGTEGTFVYGDAATTL